MTSPPFEPDAQDIQNLQKIRRAINRTTYHGGLGLRESGQMLGTMTKLLASFGIGPDDHGELDDDDPLKKAQAGTTDLKDAFERAVQGIARSGQYAHEGLNYCRCPAPRTCPYCSRTYPCDCAGCPSNLRNQSDTCVLDNCHCPNVHVYPCDCADCPRKSNALEP